LAIAVEQKDGYTADHCQRIKEFAMRLGEFMNLSSSEMYPLNFGALFHDVGKVKVPEEILNKPGKLTDDEWFVMKKHTDFGAEILLDTKLPSLQVASNMVKYHHECWDGKGYHGLGGTEIPIGACIVAVVDSYEAMTTDRAYQRARTREQALEELVRCRGTMYRPDVVDAFIKLSSGLLEYIEA
jgi:putative nucleotidyltransferase with HDIG domain